MMSHSNLLGLHLESFTSFCSTPPQPASDNMLSTISERASLTGIRHHLSATPLEGQSGFLANSIPVTGYEPNTCIDVSSEHAPINYTYRKNGFDVEDHVTTTVAASENSDGFHKQAAASGSSQFVPTDEVNPWLSAELLQRDMSNIKNVGETYSRGKREIEILKVWAFV